MPKAPSPDDAVRLAEEAQRARLDAVRALAVARQEVHLAHESAAVQRSALEAQLAEQIAAAERADARAFLAATSIGWTPSELRKIGLPEPARTRRARRSRAALRDTSPTDSSPAATGEATAPEGDAS